MSFKLGVDGGGTKTECILIDDSGSIIARHRAEGCNPSIVGSDAAQRVVLDAIRALLSGRSVSTTLLCMAGSRLFWRETAAGLTGLGLVIAVDDSLPVLELATSGGPGLVLHAGTGSFVAAREAVPSDGAVPFGAIHYAGGLGWRFGDPGSAYDIGRRAVARGLLELQGWMPDSGMGRLLQEYTGFEESNAVSRELNREKTSNSKTAGIAPEVLRLAESGNAAAREIAVGSAMELLELACRVAARVFPETPSNEIIAGLSGPILTHPVVAQALRERAPFALKLIGDAPIEGVRRVLARIG
jgi:N-acetylglucosamine kinase-like BadF-type ATPase